MYKQSRGRAGLGQQVQHSAPWLLYLWASSVIIFYTDWRKLRDWKWGEVRTSFPNTPLETCTPHLGACCDLSCGLCAWSPSPGERASPACWRTQGCSRPHRARPSKESAPPPPPNVGTICISVNNSCSLLRNWGERPPWPCVLHTRTNTWCRAWRHHRC